jgi:hypothetical protein
LEALVAAVEPAVRQAHSVIGNGVTIINIRGHHNQIGRFDEETKAYVSQSIEDRTIINRDLSVASFNANSGYGSVYDPELGRTVPIKLTKDPLEGARAVLSWAFMNTLKELDEESPSSFFA